MRLDNINSYWHLLEAARAGKTIQFQQFIGDERGWVDAHGLNFDEPPNLYRVKPEESGPTPKQEVVEYNDKTNPEPEFVIDPKSDLGILMRDVEDIAFKVVRPLLISDKGLGKDALETTDFFRRLFHMLTRMHHTQAHNFWSWQYSAKREHELKSQLEAKTKEMKQAFDGSYYEAWQKERTRANVAEQSLTAEVEKFHNTLADRDKAVKYYDDENRKLKEDFKKERARADLLWEQVKCHENGTKFRQQVDRAYKAEHERSDLILKLEEEQKRTAQALASVKEWQEKAAAEKKNGDYAVSFAKDRIDELERQIGKWNFRVENDDKEIVRLKGRVAELERDLNDTRNNRDSIGRQWEQAEARVKQLQEFNENQARMLADYRKGGFYVPDVVAVVTETKDGKETVVRQVEKQNCEGLCALCHKPFMSGSAHYFVCNSCIKKSQTDLPVGWYDYWESLKKAANFCEQQTKLHRENKATK